MAAGDNSALGTLTLKDKTGQSPGDPSFMDRISMPGDADYKAGGTSGLLAAYQKLTGTQRMIIAATYLGSYTTSGPAAETDHHVLNYHVLSDKIQVFGLPSLDGNALGIGAALAEVANGTNRSAKTDVWLVISK